MYTKLSKEFIEEAVSKYFTDRSKYRIYIFRLHKFYNEDKDSFINFFKINYPNLNPLTDNPDEFLYLIKYGNHKNMYCPICGKLLSRFNLTNGILCDNKKCNKKIGAIKLKELFLKKYGVSNPSCLKEIQEKRENTMIDRFGVNNIMYCKEGIERQKQSIINKFGVDNVSKLQEIKDKKRDTIIKNFGNYSNFIDHTIGEFCKSFGVTNSMKLQWVKDNLKNTCIKRFGTANVLSNEQVKEKIKQYWIDRYGVDNVSKVDFIRQKLKIAVEEKAMLIDHTMNFLTGLDEYHALNKIQDYINIKILRQVGFGKFRADGYIPEYNLILEYDEPFHEEDYTREIDTRKNEFIKSFSKSIIHRIKHIDWIKNNDEECKKVKQLLDNINERYKPFLETSEKGVIKFVSLEK